MSLLVSPLFAAPASPLEADFPDGYWDRDGAAYGRASTMYSLSVAVADPAKTRAEIERLFKDKDSEAKLTSFNEHPLAMSPMDAGGVRARMAYTLAYQMPVSKAAAVAKKLLDIGRLTTYSVNTPYGAPQAKELQERIGWIEREKKESGEKLKTMPVSRSLLESKLKRLKLAQDAIKAMENIATITIQILKEEPEKGGDARPQPKTPLVP
ncbi:MAG TPA: hypothetical protein DCM05_08620 [Elusimicrobia bacterium]|nr:hypothetical protein [Elusimicrobiota bacterium]